KAFSFAVPRTKDRSLDFSFSGLKTAALRHIRERGVSKGSPALADFLASFEEIVARSLLDNLRRGVDETRPRSLVLCGGVARNARLRTRFQEFARDADLPAFVPSPKLCTDNGAMVAAAALRTFARHPDLALALDIDAYPR
ncbi:MAG: tRNA (adenosine(37)-N6)-threonylcarbamoyltransferase complex transferase subunit TsaD, partial [Candidatus Aminicenantales bacterium]